MIKPFNAVRVLASVVSLLACTVAVQAKDVYPAGPIRLIIPYSPGGNVDITARAIGTAMGNVLKQSVVMSNMDGAGSTIGAAYVARAKPDGYTILITTVVALVTDPTVIPGTKIRAADFDPIGLMAVVPSVLEVKNGNQKGIKDFAGFIAYAKAHPGAVSVSNSGLGTTNHIAELLLEKDFGIKLNLIPYRGSGPALTDLMGGQTDAEVDQLTSSQPLIAAGNLLPIASTAAKRTAGLPNVPTVSELGKKDFEMVTTSILMAPKGTPLAVRQTLNDALRKALADPKVVSALRNTGADVAPSTIADVTKALATEQARLQPLIDSGAIAPQKD